ncbi:MAG: FaeA/PapI family transcriptional regulator [Chloroflexi bacterium]|nr:FaeA/PapI family transcriptional regulator [Chloroflexota bacterium]MCL5107451.1 FaeA/PapI family transcriptional regulator [Chloroflexota bacterium]
MSESAGGDLKQRILDYLGTVSKAKNREVANALGVSKHEADNAINDLAKEDKIEFLYLGTSYVTLKGKGQG